ncbi:MAG: MFS transporter [Bacteroidetes bacterium]|nr:MAG: MFS transporter [Bacteroidota bacterium]
MQKGDKKIITAWSFYDWANSVYPLVITSTIFPIYYLSVTKTNAGNTVHFLGREYTNTTLYDFALAIAFLVIAVISPLLSGIADYSGSKKRFMQFFCYLGALSCSAMYFFTGLENLWIGILTVILACIGYAGSIVFYNAFLPEIAEPEDHDRVSAKGFSMGYIGSGILLILNLVMVMKPEFWGFENAEQATRISFLTVGAWWILFAQIPFYYLPNNVYGHKPEGHYLFNGYLELKKVWKELKQHKQLAKFLSAFFVYNMGVQTVMLIATLFGSKELNLESSQLIIVILVIQFVAIIGAYAFSSLSGKKGNIFTLKVAVMIWIGVCVAAYFVYTAAEFYIIAAIVGLVMGGIQSLSRSTYSKMLPETEDHASYFSFYDVTEKLCIVCGMALFGLIEQVSENMRNPILALILFFVVGFTLLLRIPKTTTKYE